MYDEENCVWFVSWTSGGDFNPSMFNVTRLSESYVAKLIKHMELAASLAVSDDVFSIGFWDYAPDFAADQWRQAEGEEDPQCILNRDVRLGDILALEAERAFLRMIPHSLERALIHTEMDGGICVQMGSTIRKVCPEGVYWHGRPKHTDIYIETCCVTMKELVRLRDWLATVRQIQEQA